MKEILGRLQENRQIELAKSILESAGEVPGITDTIFRSIAAAKKAVENYLANN